MMPPATSPSPSSSRDAAAHLRARPARARRRPAAPARRRRVVVSGILRKSSSDLQVAARRAPCTRPRPARAPSRRSPGWPSAIASITLRVRDVVGAQLVRIEHDLVLPHHAADASRPRRRWARVFSSYLRNQSCSARSCDRSMRAAAIDQRVLVDPADAGRIGAERRPWPAPAAATAPGSGTRARASAPSTGRCRPRTARRRTSRRRTNSRAPSSRPAPTASSSSADR